MSDDNKMTLSELGDRLLAMQSQLDKVSDENRSLKSQNAELVRVRSDFAKLQDTVKHEAINTHRSKIKEAIEQAVREDKILPAARERFCRVYRVDDDEAVMTIDVDMVAEFVRDNPNPKPRKPAPKTTFALTDPAGDVPAGTRADEELRLRTFALARSRGVASPDHEQIETFAKEVLQANPELGQRWKNLDGELDAA
jgi:hypothetical protein